MSSFPMGKLDFLHCENRVQKTFVLCTQVSYFFDFWPKSYRAHLGKQSRNRTGIPEREKLSWSARKLAFSKTRIHVQKVFVFCRCQSRQTSKYAGRRLNSVPPCLVDTRNACPGAYPGSHAHPGKNIFRSGGVPPPSLPI